MVSLLFGSACFFSGAQAEAELLAQEAADAALYEEHLREGQQMTPESPGWDPDPIFRKIIRKIGVGLERFRYLWCVILVTPGL